MKENKRQIIIFGSIAMLILTVIIAISFFRVKNQNAIGTLSQEDLRAMNYEQITKEEEEAQNEYVKFLAFFTRDLNKDGYAEKIKGTCKEISDTDELYMEFNVLTDGYFTDGVITLNAGNFTWKTAIISDNIVNGDYIGDTTRICLQDEILAGSQKTLWGTIHSEIGNNINDYSRPATVTLTGKHVSNDGTVTPINKTVNLTVDWYGDVKAQIANTSISEDISKIKTNNDTVGFLVNLYTRESNGKLILKENVITAEIPQFNGYNPVKVTTSGEYTYDENTRKLTASRTSTVNEEGVVTQALSRYNTYTINIEYPKEAYLETTNSVSLKIPVTTYYVGYNNSNEEFENPKQSNIAEDIAIITYREPAVYGYIYNFYITVGEKGRNGRTVSKEKPLQIYNGITEKTEKDYYTVEWELTRGNLGDASKVVMKETPEQYTDQFLNTSGNYTDMLNYIDNIGIYFSGATDCLGEKGYINVYNDETNELIHTFTKNDWGKYSESKPYKYKSGVKHIRIETSRAYRNSYFSVYNIKEINDELLTEEISKQEFDKFKRIYSYLKGSIQIDGTSSMSSINKIGEANYESKVSYASIGISESQISTQETQENFEIYISTVANSFNDQKWKNGQFIVKLPSEIIKAKINDVTINNKNVQILGYDIYEENGSYFIKIITENEQETTYGITINCDIAPDPGAKTSSRAFELYSYNEIGENYYNPIKDIYDANGNNNLEEKVNYSVTTLSFITPSTIITRQYASNYNKEDNITIAPNIAGVTKEQRTANINVALLNNYSKTIREVKLIGVIPSEGNSYIVNGKDLGSEFTVQMSNSGINIPDELKDIVTVYYSENSHPNKDLNDSSNGWTKNPSDWTKVKTYLIDFGDFSLPVSKSYTFTYEVKIPEGIKTNKVSYSEHALYYALDTEQGKLLTQTEPSKLGIKIERKYNVEFTKYKKGKDLVVPGATYKLIEKAEDGSEVGYRLGTTNLDGKMQIKNIIVGNKYTLKEIKAAENYYLNEDEITFEVIENADENLEVNILSEATFANTPVIEKDTNGKDVLKANVEDEPKFKIVITKTDEKTGDKLKNIKFTFNSKIYTTNADGQIVLDNLQENTEYTLKETKANGYYILDEIKFKVVKNTQGKLSIESENLNFSNAVIENTNKEHLIKVNVNLENEKIASYNLQILKVREDAKENDVEKLEHLQGATFRLIGEDLNYQKDYTTNKDGYIDIPDLYQFVEGKNITGNYSIQEIKAPDGYASCNEEIKFRVITNNEGNLEIQIVDKDNLKTIRNIQANENTIKLIIEDKPLFKLIKTDKETGKLLANAKFVIYEIEETGKIIGYARDVNGKYVGERDKDEQYVVTTDENGTITLALRGGLYRISEIGFPEGYEEFAEDEFFRIMGGKIEEDVVVEPEKPTEEKEIILIDSIEDLVKLSNAVNDGDTYSNKIVKLTKTLDFDDNGSYKNINDKSFGDLNRDGTIEGIKAELTDKVDGCGFTPIGKFYNNVFSGVFDGQENEIKNLYINHYKEDTDSTSGRAVGLFGYVKKGTIKNLGVTGNINSSTKANYIGGIAGRIEESSVLNCYNKANISVDNATSSGPAGGIAGSINSESSIINSYNTGNISGVLADSEYAGVGGIVGRIESSSVKNSYNTGNVKLNADNASGSVGEIVGSTSDDNYIVQNCYHLDSIEIIGNNKTNCSEPKTEEFMKTEEFINLLGINNWKLDENNVNLGYPILIKSKVEKISKINSIEDLVKLSQQVNNGETYNGEKVILTKNLDFEADSSYINPSDKSFGDINKDGKIEGIKAELTDKEDGCGFMPIGKGYGYKFSGEFDGKNNKIEHLYIRQKAENNEYIGTYSSEYIGLFGYLENATITNLTITGNIKEQGENSKHTTYRGGIAAYAIDSNITNCNNMIDIEDIEENRLTAHNNYAGGIVGYADNCVINNNSNEGNISFRHIEYSNYVGGIVGYAKKSSITNNSNIATIYVYSNYCSYVGGIAGEISSTIIDNCYNLDDIRTSSKKLSYSWADADAGGILGIGENSSSISNCYNKGEINGQCCGGIVYSMQGGTLNNCYNTGAVDGDECAGGIVGSINKGTLNSSYNTGSIDSGMSYIGASMFSFSGCAGGIAGKSDSSSISNTFNKGEIRSGTLSSSNCCGGIVGEYTPRSVGSIANSYNIGDIYSSGVYGTIYAGNSHNDSIINCYHNVSEHSYISGSGTRYLNGEYEVDYYMKQKQFYNWLNVDRAWIYKPDSYPMLAMGVPTDINEVTELNINNTFKTYKVTTDVKEINGVKGGEISGEDKESYEIIPYDENNTKRIVMTPDEGYGIINITINNKKIEYEVNNDGTYIIPVGYFTNVKEDKHIVVTYTSLDQLLTINKVDKEDRSKQLSGAKFKVEQIEDRQEIKNEMGNIVANGPTYMDNFSTKKEITGVTGPLTDNGTIDMGDFYISDSYIKVDLTNKSGLYLAVINMDLTCEDINSCRGNITTSTNTDIVTNYSELYIYPNQGSQDYTTVNVMQGGNIYYLHIAKAYYSGVDIQTTVNSVKIYEQECTTYNFEEKNGKFVSNNQGKDNTVANSYIPIDLSKTKGKYNLKINAEISSENSDYGYVTITETTDAPSHSSSTGRILHISGEQEAKDYDLVLEAGNMYYLHLGYYKDSSKNEGTDTFTINSIELSLNTDDFYSGEFTTNEYGQIREVVPVGKYKITEIEAPEEYNLKEEPTEFTVETGKDNTVTIENSHLPKLIVHHYLVGTGPENRKPAVVLAEDENYSGKIGENYTTAPRIDLDPYALITDKEGNYIIPSNASGKYTKDNIEVTYYYTKAPVTLTVHHYLEGTEEKLAEDEGPTRHEIGAEYETNPSEEVLESYDLVNVVGEEKGMLTEDTEVIYYYKIKEHVITTRVEIAKEEQEQGRTEKGGKISGENLKPYETVQHGKNSKEELKMTPNNGYRINKITINKINGEEVISSEDVLFKANEDDTYELPKFENVTNDYEVVVQFMTDIGNVIVHHYIEGTEIKIAPNEITKGEIGKVVNTKEIDTSKYNLVEESEKYVLVQAPEEKDVTIEREDKEVTYYYQAQYKITTDVIPYDEKQTDGTIKSVRGGEISGEDEAPYEAVLKGKDSTKEIKASPDKGFMITGMKINGKVYDYTKKLADDGTVTLDKFTKMNEDKHIEVEFRRISNVIVQYILKEPDGTTKLFAEDEIPGYVGKDYETRRINITNYRASTDEEGNVVPSNKDGLMAVDTIYVKYYYEKIPAGITVKHVEKVLNKEIVEVTDEETGETKEEIKTSFIGTPIDGVEDEYIKGYVGEDETTYRKEIKGYISSLPIDPEETIENLINAKQEEKEITVTYKENDIIEIVYWYEREFNITTDVKEHEEKVKNEEGNVVTILAKGGNITGELTEENTEPVEKVLRGRDSTKEIKIEPDYGYVIKSITLKDGENESEVINIDEFMQEDRTAIIPVGYFEYMQADKHIEVEFERIPAKVIVKYLDVVTKEELLPEKEIDGYVKDQYDEPRVDIDTYIKINPEPENSKGEMTEDTITVIYYYQKQYKITTDVKEHEELEKKPLVDVIVKKQGEDSEENKSENENQNNNLDTNKPENGNSNIAQDGSQSGENSEQKIEENQGEQTQEKPEQKKIMVKGGNISGEDEMPYEIVTRGEDNIKVIQMKPDYGYRIKSLTIKDGQEEAVIYIDNLLTKEGTIVLPEKYFTNMQADKHIVVEYEPIPAKVTVKYLEKDTEEKVADSEKGEGFVDYEYKTYPKEIPYYELIEEELPENAEGKLVEDETTVIYYYKKLPFNMKVEKQIEKITINGQNVDVINNKNAKVEIESKKVNETKLEISYKVKVTNTERIAGKAIIEELIPDGFSFDKENSSKEWEEADKKYTLTTKTLAPGESVEYIVTLLWDASKENNGSKVNIAKIAETENIPKFNETTLDDNQDNATLDIEIKINIPKTGQARIVYMLSVVIAGTCIGVIVWRKKKNNEK